ncbi:HigA family addiction module antidote protein [Treponema sp. OMZ 792]|uniref:HigA family addiction module antitoxin n=1 Tax=unclassified Treponema TaxID=2638727 RepID=UPI0020A26D5A|nr:MULTISPECIES: HigA family addiction module antitoxin [unclassified Treponema]UTC75246.1 HigA family addiction module antidote protein [Treponema sp. OMZ 792]UTC78958.1 HigA family addiction module antidote protein [Treponema sp. OMZ 799]UTC79252.1 HigA family addiction module antidote protein [Treponema sp. OMZ 798]
MSDYIETPTMGEILNEEFFIPLGLSAYKVAKEINVPTSRIQDILHNRRRITVDTSLRLAKFFGMSDGYFMSLQNDIDIRNAKLELAPQLEEIKTYVYA